MADLHPPVRTYQRRPEASRIEAVQFDGTGEMASQILRWSDVDHITASNVATDNETVNDPASDRWRVTLHPTDTEDATMHAHKGDWVAKGALGQVYVIPDDIMTATYDVEASTESAGSDG